MCICLCLSCQRQIRTTISCSRSTDTTGERRDGQASKSQLFLWIFSPILWPVAIINELSDRGYLIKSQLYYFLIRFCHSKEGNYIVVILCSFLNNQFNINIIIYHHILKVNHMHLFLLSMLLLFVIPNKNHPLLLILSPIEDSMQWKSMESKPLFCIQKKESDAGLE